MDELEACDYELSALNECDRHNCKTIIRRLNGGGKNDGEATLNSLLNRIEPLFEDIEDEKPALLLEPEFVEVSAHKRERKPKATYDEIFENIKTTRVSVDPLPEEDRTCPECGSLMIPIGTEVVRTEVVYHKPSLERIEYVATSYRCPNADKEADTLIVQDKANPALIPGSYASESLVAHVMNSKFTMALPFYRLEQEFLSLGAKIGRGTMANWTIICTKEYLG